MNRFLLAILFLALPSLALAGTTITVSVGTTSEAWTLSDTDQQKFEAWVQTSLQVRPLFPDCYNLAPPLHWPRARRRGPRRRCKGLPTM